MTSRTEFRTGPLGVARSGTLEFTYDLPPVTYTFWAVTYTRSRVTYNHPAVT
jgi:hypothetical protein